MDFELTGDDIAEAIQSAERDGHNTHSQFCYRAVAKAAQRKLVELFDKRWRSYEENGEFNGSRRMTFSIDEEQWQELRKGVGLK